MHRLTFPVVTAFLALGATVVGAPTDIGSGIQITLSRPGLPSPNPFAPKGPSPFGAHEGPRITGFDSGWVPCNRPRVPRDRGCAPAPCRVNPGYWRNGCWYAYGPVYDGLPQVGEVERESPEIIAPVEAPALPEPDRAMVDLHEGRYLMAAAEFLRRHDQRLREEAAADGAAIPDRSALRLAALALAGAGQGARSAERFAEAYRDDPRLGADSIESGQMLGSTTEARRIMAGAVRFAHRTESADAWAQVGYLMQAEGRHDRARIMMDRALAMR